METAFAQGIPLVLLGRFGLFECDNVAHLLINPSPGGIVRQHGIPRLPCRWMPPRVDDFPCLPPVHAEKGKQFCHPAI
jgi:hypothetical protein